MGYHEALIAAGANVKEFKMFGSYRGTWMALLNNKNIVEGSYGSCSGCDAFEAEFSWSDREDDPQYQQKLTAFGNHYLAGIETLDEIIAHYEYKVTQEYAWDDDREILEWLKTKK